MSLDPDMLSRLLHDLTPESPVQLTVDDIVVGVRRRKRTRTTAMVAVICLLVAGAIALPLTLDRRTGAGGPSPTGPTAPPETCDAGAMDMSLTWRSASSNGLAGILLLSNRSGRSCLLRDRPTLAPLDRAGKPLPAVQFEPNPAAPRPLMVPAGGSAVSVVSWADWCRGPAPSNQIRISWPGGGSRAVAASGPHPKSACPEHVFSPAGDLSSNWFASLLSPPDGAVPVTSNETFMSGQVTVQPPNRPASDFPATARDALMTFTPAGYVGNGTVTVEYGLFSDNVQGTNDPATPKITKLFYQRVPAFLVILRTPNLSVPGGARAEPGVVLTGIEAATGKALGVYEQTGDVTGETSSQSACSWTLLNNGTMVTTSHGTTSVTAHVGDRFRLVDGAGCRNRPVLRITGGTAGFTATSDNTLTVGRTGTGQLQVVLVGCTGIASPCFGGVIAMATLQISVMP